jgi:hypothetical protein
MNNEAICNKNYVSFFKSNLYISTVDPESKTKRRVCPDGAAWQ